MLTCTSACRFSMVSRSRQCCKRSSSFSLRTAVACSVARCILALPLSPFCSICFSSPARLPKASSTFRRRLSTSRRRAEAISRTVLMEASMSSFMSFQAVMSVLASSLACVCCACSAMSSESCWQRSWHSCRLCDTSSIQASCALRASCMSPMSSRIVEISAVTVASTRWREVMIEWVESTRARISSRSTFTASMAAVKSSMSLSQARTIRLTCDVSLLAPLSKSFSSPMSYFTESKSCDRLSKPGAPSLAPARWELRKEIFFSTSWLRACSCVEICDSKSLILLVIFLSSWLSPTLGRLSLDSLLPPRSARTRASSFLKRSVSVLASSSDCLRKLVRKSRDSAWTTSDAYFLTSESTCSTSAVDASRKVTNIVSVSFRTMRNCSHSSTMSGRLILPQALLTSASTDSVFLWQACMVSISKCWLASMVAKVYT
mmetsp:Transcript_28851/g.68601  ORF Transcript_28851/g.68601 Transcript_28851/m.68601 type:complete len:433 (+) Transcript_28851:1095-2393(+)